CLAKPNFPISVTHIQYYILFNEYTYLSCVCVEYRMHVEIIMFRERPSECFSHHLTVAAQHLWERNITTESVFFQLIPEFLVELDHNPPLSNRLDPKQVYHPK